jgi:hypothetical protein
MTNAQERLMKLLETRRFCYVIPIDSLVDGHGYRVSIAVEHERGHFPTGDMDTLSPERKTRQRAFANGKSVPWFWGNTLEEAQAICRRENEKLGYSAKDVALIVASTLGGK